MIKVRPGKLTFPHVRTTRLALRSPQRSWRSSTPAAKSVSGPSLYSLEIENPARKPTCAPGLLECVTGLGRR